MSNTFVIKKGPSKFELTANLFSHGSKKQRASIFFDGEKGCGGVNVILNQLSRADDSGESWNLQGIAINVTINADVIFAVSGLYNTETKNGHLNFL